MTREQFTRFTDKLRSFGYQVYLNKKNSFFDSNYAVFTDGKNVGGINESQFDTFVTVHLNTIHKPCRGAGTGFAIGREKEHFGTDYDYTLDELTPSVAQQAFKTVPPGFENDFFGPIRKYRDFEDWKQNSPYRDQYEI